MNPGSPAVVAITLNISDSLLCRITCGVLCPENDPISPNSSNNCTEPLDSILISKSEPEINRNNYTKECIWFINFLDRCVCTQLDRNSWRQPRACVQRFIPVVHAVSQAVTECYDGYALRRTTSTANVACGRNKQLIVTTYHWDIDLCPKFYKKKNRTKFIDTDVQKWISRKPPEHVKSRQVASISSAQSGQFTTPLQSWVIWM